MELLIDVRTPVEYEDGHIENAINIPLTEIVSKIDEIAENKETAIRLYCLTGRRSALVGKVLYAIGYRNIVNEGAYKELEERLKKGSNG
ncbi:MAG: rhodanese-like domain-containing protein [Candidatus Anammoxibacter sp.]